MKKPTGPIFIILLMGLMQENANGSSEIAGTNATNLPPTFDAISDRTVAEDSAAMSVLLTGVSPGKNEARQTVSLIALSSNPAVVPSPAVSRTGVTRTLVFQAVPNANGNATLTVTAIDDGNPAQIFSRSFVITVTAVNDSPLRVAPVTIAPVIGFSGTSVVFSAGLSSLSYVAGPADEDSQALTYTVTTIPAIGVGKILPCQNCAPVAVGSSYSLTQMRALLFKPAATGSSGSGLFSWTTTDNGTPPMSVLNTLSVSRM